MVIKLLLEKFRNKHYFQPIEIVDARRLAAATHPLAFHLLTKLSHKPAYPKILAQELGVDLQKVYYHVQKLERAGLIKVIREERRKGGVCKYYSTSARAFGFELSSNKELLKPREEKLKHFFQEFLGSRFNGLIVVGAPTPHGPYLTAARDGYCAVQLAMWLGNYCELPEQWVVKLDTEVKTSKELKQNLIVIGGPIANTLSAELNPKLKVRFEYEAGWQIRSGRSGKCYREEEVGLIAKFRNPFDFDKVVVMLAGLRYAATKACVLALTKYPQIVLKHYAVDQEFYAVIKGLDKDGDGVVDEIRVLES